jgi:hypothetical protein
MAIDMGLAKAGAWQRGHISNAGEQSPVFFKPTSGRVPIRF